MSNDDNAPAEIQQVSKGKPVEGHEIDLTPAWVYTVDAAANLTKILGEQFADGDRIRAEAERIRRETERQRIAGELELQRLRVETERFVEEKDAEFTAHLARFLTGPAFWWGCTALFLAALLLGLAIWLDKVEVVAALIESVIKNGLAAIGLILAGIFGANHLPRKDKD